MTGIAVVADVVLSVDERRRLARAATRIYETQRYMATREFDPLDPERHVQLRLRWQAIADALDPEPYGPQHRAAEMAQRAREATEEAS
jgi:hypothetical protein